MACLVWFVDNTQARDVAAKLTWPIRVADLVLAMISELHAPVETGHWLDRPTYNRLSS